MFSVQLEFATIDVFTHTKYEGNPLAIVRVPKSVALKQEQKQAIAREFNLSETTFLHEKASKEDEDEWTVDIFTTNQELPFAGHPTIGTACHVLSQTARERNVAEGMIDAKFKLKAGDVDLVYDVRKGTARAAIPHDVHIHQKALNREKLLDLHPELMEPFKAGIINLKDSSPIVSIVKGMTFVLVELESEDALGLVTTTAFRSLPERLDDGWDKSFVGMYFYVRRANTAEGVKSLRTRMIEGTLEDPATGSAASDLAAYLSLIEGKPKQALRYVVEQGVEMGRRSIIQLEVEMAETGKDIKSLYLEGGVVQVMEGRLTI